MKVKQQTLKGFECDIDDIDTFKSYYAKNAPLMQGHLLILKGKVDASVTAFLDERAAIYIDGNEKALQTRKKRSTAVLEVPVTQAPNEDAHTVKDEIAHSSIYHRPIRSGESIQSNKNLVFMGRINSGALIESSSSIQLFGIIDGSVRSDGDYILLQEIGKGTVFFHGEELESTQFNGQLKLVEYKEGTIVVKEVE